MGSMHGTNLPSAVVSTRDSEHYRWGGKNGEQSDGWYLLRASGMHVIEESMPPDATETRHFHTKARQFFYVLEGELTMEIEHHLVTLKSHEGIEILPGQHHRACNRGGKPLRLLVISQPPSHGDRIDSA